MELCFQALHGDEAQHLAGVGEPEAVAMGKWTDTNAARTAKLIKRRESLRSVVEKFKTTDIRKWMAMAIDFYNDEL